MTFAYPSARFPGIIGPAPDAQWRYAMNWSELLKEEIEDTYQASDRLMSMVQDDELGWKPASGENWMNLGQLLMHMTSACGFCFRGFVTGDWTPGAEGAAESDTTTGDATGGAAGGAAGDAAGGATGDTAATGAGGDQDWLPPAERMPSVASVQQARDALAEDRTIALDMLEQAGENRLSFDSFAAPWDQRQMPLGRHLLHMVLHLATHKAQLFYYLKLMGRKVDTNDLWGS
ncbi:MAG: DinB family protein [Candidatus Krumholzibacteriia bacterium]